MAKSPTDIADRLLAAGVIQRDKYEGAVHHFQSYGGFIEESLIEVGAIDEAGLLKHLAQLFRTRFVSTDKLRRADIPKQILDRVPLAVAQKHNVLPILFDEQQGMLSVVTSDPSRLDVEEEVRLIAKASKVRSFIARPAAIKAAIAKFYRGDIHAFAALDKDSFQAFHTMMDVYERNVLDEATLAAALAKDGSERVLSASDLERPRSSVEPPAATAAGSWTAMVEMVKVMVSLLEASRGDLAGHSVLVGGYVERMCRRIGLAPREVAAMTLAGLLHDLGKGSPYHLTPFNVAEWEGHRTAAEKRYDTPLRLFESVDLPPETRDGLRHMYERPDGKGLPEGQKGREIPLAARILAMADTFADLTSNPRNPYRRILSTAEAMDVLGKAKGRVFDENLVELFGVVVAGEDIKRKLLTGAQTVLVVDPDPEQCAVMDLQLTSRGFRVRTATTADAAIKAVFESPVNLVLSEVELQPIDGFALKKRLDAEERLKNVPFVFYTSRGAAADVRKGFELGAADYVTKPSPLDLVVAKINKYLEQAAPAKGGVAGSLREMSLPDLVQILAHGRKSGQLKLVMGNHRGEIHFVDGEIHNAFFDELRGEEAFFAMLKYREGTFALNPDFVAEERVIRQTAEMLLLEGLRRFDEENR